jgi:hypothetical protein
MNMKNSVLIALLIFTLISCTKNKDEDFPQKWQLIKMFGGQIGYYENTGTDMAWQEYYLLNSNGTFIKHRERSGKVIEASGTFTFKNKSDSKYFYLTYNSGAQFIGSCYSNNLEMLFLGSGNNLFNTWSDCDGPGLEYARIE